MSKIRFCKFLLKSILLIFSIVVISCNNKHNAAIPYAQNPEISSKVGEPKDSAALYFPFGLGPKDPMDLDHTKFYSYGLYKLKEPVLFNYYLHKEVYRLVFVSKSRISVIRIEKLRGKVFLEHKEMNKEIGYPFVVFFGSKPEVTKAFYRIVKHREPTAEEYAKVKTHDDSMANIYNRADYFPVSVSRKEITRDQWKAFMNRLEKISFWTKRDSISNRRLYSRCILEGHCRHGYQIKEFDEKDKFISEFFKWI